MSNMETIRLLRDALVAGERFALVAGNILQFLPQTDDTGYLSIGNSTYAMDFKWFGSTSAQYALFDVGNSLLTLEDIDLALGDNDHLVFGDNSDIRVRWNGTYLESAPATGFWSGCPSPGDPDPSKYFEVFDHFTNWCVGDATSPWTLDATNGTVTLGTAVTANTPGVGGYITLDSSDSADNDFVIIKQTVTDTAGAPFFIKEDTHKLWYECRVMFGSVTDCSFWFGLVDPACTEPMVDNTGAENVTDGIGFRTLCASPTKIDTWTNQSGTESEVAGDAYTIATNTEYKFGMYFDGAATLTYYVDGTALGDTLTIADAGNVPNDVGLVPFFALKDGNGAAESIKLHVDYIKCVQLLS